ncbi:MAG: proteasome accessory factor PafA2 [Actinobacteria bacterium]|jgi:Pup amidohydrolase|nr:proteasome accessory factor PafA2 [Actinomycetota bacterium]
MAIHKVCGIETEYGIITRGFDANPVVASSVLVNAYAGNFPQLTGWDFADETPGSDARGFALEDAFPPEVETHLVNSVLTNGARYYVDHAHPEVSTPECTSASQVVLFDRAAEEVIRRSAESANEKLPAGHEIVLYKNNSDGKGNSYGCHENYLVDRNLPFGRLASLITTHFVTRQVFTGAGKVGCEQPGRSAAAVPFQISQRADFFEEEIGLETTLKRPIVNTRDEPHCNPNLYRRLHVIVGDANMSEVATFLKVGTTAIVLAMIEDDFLPHNLQLSNPLPAITAVSHDPTLRTTVERINGQRLTALEMQFLLLEYAEKYNNQVGLSCVETPGEGGEAELILRRWKEVLEGLESNQESVSTIVDWVAKKRLVDGFAERHALSPGHAKLKAIDLQYHDMRPDRCLAARVGLETLWEVAEVQLAVSEPPASTRAFFRGKCLQKWPTEVVAANWDSLVFDVGDEPLRRVPMMEPMRGTRLIVGDLLDGASSPRHLIELLGAGASEASGFIDPGMY